MNNPVLVCEGLAKIYEEGASKVDVFNQVNLAIQPAEMVAIVGASGSGKSTLLHLLGGLDQPTKGRVMLNNQDLNQVSEIEKCRLRNYCLGFVYQFHHLLSEFSALENVAMPLLLRDEPATSQAKDKAATILEQVGLGKRIHHRIGQLSGGERQRVAIARALVTDPLCVLADEPTGNLDPNNAEKVLQLFFDLQAARKTSVVLVTHDLTIAKRAGRVLRIEAGQLVEVK